MPDFECDDNETPQLLKPRDESPDREIMFRRSIGPSGSGTTGDDDEAGHGDVQIRDEYRGVGENFYRKEYPLGPNQRDFPDRNQNIRGNNPDFDNQIPTGFPRGSISITTIKPEPYNGKDSWEEYISHFENCSDLGRWKESEKVLLLAASLQGPARTFYISLTSTENKILLFINKDCRSVTEAVELNERYKALLGDPNDRKKGNIRQVSDTKTYLNTQDTDMPVQSKENESILQQLINRIDRLEHGSNSSQTTQRGPRTCFTCNSADHFYRNCPLYKRPAGPNQASPPNSNWSEKSPSYQGQRSGNNQQNQGNGYPSAHQTGARRS
ncbi:Hypothetical predicted protein [Mytilus galloprovincialis]|uniref:CCHC-type domain-containing protein n=1 Tax=Mytilus galloprovincialis TaxID=29158 RepID=A0A8B6H7E0_MYTGA|nr:Hypothetical predicted protein [Mytilus galloprovincialis]